MPFSKDFFWGGATTSNQYEDGGLEAGEGNGGGAGMVSNGEDLD